MIRRWLERRRTQKACPHPAEQVSGHLTDIGSRKQWHCHRCDKLWIS